MSPCSVFQAAWKIWDAEMNTSGGEEEPGGEA